MKSLNVGSQKTQFSIVAKEEGCVAGAWLWDFADAHFGDGTLKLKTCMEDGDEVENKSVVVTGTGKWNWIMEWERILLNIMGYMSGIATKTEKIVERVRKSGSEVDIVETRKILPGFRALAKYAVTCGGGKNHRYNLSSGLLVKENHIYQCGGIRNTLEKLLFADVPEGMESEIELKSPKEVNEFVKAIEGFDRPAHLKWVMLDNFTPRQIQDMAPLLKGFKIEASGGIDEDSLMDYAALPIDRISMGALTHSVKSLDLSLLVEN